ncbi:RHS repeat protein [Stieleria neptunia]|nr:RHS repeat protein [Stieleria neptunia]
MSSGEIKDILQHSYTLSCLNSSVAYTCPDPAAPAKNWPSTARPYSGSNGGGPLGGLGIGFTPPPSGAGGGFPLSFPGTSLPIGSGGSCVSGGGCGSAGGFSASATIFANGQIPASTHGSPISEGARGNGSLIEAFGLDYMHWADDMTAFNENDLSVRRVMRSRNHSQFSSFGPMMFCNWDMALEISGTFNTVGYLDTINVRDPLAQIPYSLRPDIDMAAIPIDWSKLGQFSPKQPGFVKDAAIGDLDPNNPPTDDIELRRDTETITGSNFCVPLVNQCVVENWIGAEFTFELLISPTEEVWDELAAWNEDAYGNGDPGSDGTLTESYLLNNGYPGSTLTDPDNTHLLGRLTKIQFPDGRSAEISYKEWTPFDLYSSWERLFQIDTVTADSGETLSFTYGGSQVGGQWVVTGITNSDGQSVTYSYSGGKLTGVSRSDGTSSSFTYGTDSASGTSTVEIDDPVAEPGHRSKTVFLSSIVAGSSSYFTFPANLIRMITNPSDEATFAAVQVVDYSQPNGQRLSNYTYLGGGRLARLLPHGRIDMSSGVYRRVATNYETGWAMSVDTNDDIQVTGTEEPATSHQINDPYLAVGSNFNSTIKPNGVLQYHDYEDGWKVRTWFSDETFETWCRDEYGRVTRYRDRNGNVQKYEYGSSGGCTKMYVGLTDNPSNVESATAYGVTPTYDRCATNDVQTSEYAVHQWIYDDDYNSSGKVKLTAYINPLGKQTDLSYNSDGLLSQIQQPADSSGGTRPTTTYTYYSNGQLKTVTDPETNVVEYFYDSLDRLTSILYDDGTSHRYAYHASGNGYLLLSKSTDRAGTVTSYTYDAADRLISRKTATAYNDGSSETSTPDLESTETWYYLPGTSDPYEYQKDGAVTSYKYDAAGRRIQTTNYPRDGKTLTTKSVYVDSQLFNTEDPYGRKTYYAYDATDGRLIRTVAGTTPEFSLADFDAVIALTRDFSANASYVITDIVYDAEGNQIRLHDGRNMATEFEYDSRGRRTAQVADADYIDRSTLSSLSTALELRTETLYGLADRVKEVRSPRYFDSGDTYGYQKAREQWTYTDRGLVASHTVAVGAGEEAAEEFEYDLLGRRIERTDFRGKIWETHFEDCCGQTVASENPLGHGSIVRKDSLGRTVHMAAIEDYASHAASLDNPVNAKTYREVTTKYDGRGRPVARTTWLSARGTVDIDDPPIAGLGGVSASDGLTEQYLYDDNLADGSGLDSTGGVTPLMGSAAIKLGPALTQLADTVANGGAGVTLDSEAPGSARVVINPEGEVRFSISDAAGRSVMSGILDPSDSSLVTWNCNAYDATTSIGGYGTVLVSQNVNALGNSTQQLSDAAGRTIQAIDAIGEITAYTYDAAGNQLSVRDPNSVGQDCTYDALGRDLTCTDTSSDATSSTYDDDGNKITSTDAKSETTTYTFDARGRQIKQTDRLGGETEFAYLDSGQLESLTDAEDQVTSYTYNDAGQKLTETYPDHTSSTTPGNSGYGIVTFTLDPTGRTLRKQDQSGDTVTYNYDLAGRLTSRDYRTLANSPSGTVADTDTFTYDDASRMLTAASGRYSNTVTYTYDVAGRKATEALTIDSVTYTTATDYDATGQVSTLTYPDGTEVDRTYTDRGQLATIALDSTTVDTRTYDDGGRMLTSTYNNGVAETRAYNSDNTLSSISYTGAAIGNLSYGWDDNKNKTSESIAGTMSGYGFDVGISGYDDEDRLVNWERDDTNLDQSWNLSLVGDWDAFTENSSTQTRVHGDAHEIISAASQSVTHDAKGNMTVIPAVLRPGSDPLTLTWDFDNRLVSADVDNDSTDDVFYEWDALGRRVARDDGTTVSIYVQNGQQTVADYTSGTAATNPTYNYVYASYIDEPVVRDGTGGLRYYHRTQQYSITALTDSSGTIKERYAYDAYGNLSIFDGSGAARTSTAEGNRYTYTGREWDKELGLFHYRARMYDAISGRFLSRDPIGYSDSASLYEYVGSRILNAVDPAGLQTYVPIPPGHKPPTPSWPHPPGTTVPGGPHQPTNPRKPGWPIPKLPGPRQRPKQRNSKHATRTNLCVSCPNKAQRESPIPGVTSIPLGGYPVGVGGGENQIYPYPGSPPTNIGSGGALPCINTIIKCDDVVAVFHFTTGDDPSATLGNFDWRGNGCSAIICGGNDEDQSNCLAKEVMDSLSKYGIPLDGVSSLGACGVTPEGGWYQGL